MTTLRPVPAAPPSVTYLDARRGRTTETKGA